jgi:hypothetical protein
MRGRTVALVSVALAAAGALAVVTLAGTGTLGRAEGQPAGAAASGPTPSGAALAGAGASPVATGAPASIAPPSVAPSPTPVLVPAPLTGRLVAPALAARHPIAVMVDDQAEARPQSGFNQASVVWQAPAEGGIPRYMLIFAEGNPPAVGPVRSARQYFITWAAEWHAVYVHVGGSPQALATLATSGQGQLVYDADEFRWGPTFLWRITQRVAPHNVYSDGKHLRELATRVGATSPPGGPIWIFGPAAPPADRPTGGSITVTYPANQIGYRYDRASNTYLRFVEGEPQVDAADGRQVAPANVVVMTVVFGPLNDGHPNKKRLEAQNIGSGPAWIATNGVTVQGTWRKDSIDAPTRFYDAAGQEVVLTVGQTFIQVVPPGTPVQFVAGRSSVIGSGPEPR